MSGLRSRFGNPIAGRDRTVLAAAGITLLAVALRLFALGRRVAQYDEAWIGHWILRYAETGVWEYNPVYHGSFLPQVNRHLLGLFGFSDFVARMPVALVGGFLPLTALLLRERLRDDESLALAALLAFNPILVYYSRFMRYDVLLAGFAFAALAFGIAAFDRENPRYLYPAGVAFGLMTTTKESFLLYYLGWGGAAFLVLDGRVTAARLRGRSARAVLGEVTDPLRDRSLLGPGAVSLLLAFLVVVYFYAPRPALWNAVVNPLQLPGVVTAATLGSLEKLYNFWITGGMQDHPYLPYLLDYLRTLFEGAPAVLAFGVVGVAVDRYFGDVRSLVAFCTYWGGAFVVGYPLANFLPTPWATVHAVVPLAVPAAVGVAALVRAGRKSRARAGVVVALLLLSGGVVASTTVTTSYLAPHDGDSELVYQSQSPADMKPTLGTVHTAIAGNGGTDVLYYGEWYNLSEESVADLPPAFGGWHRRLPLAWYFEGYDATVNSTTSLQWVARTEPPVVVARAHRKSELFRALDGYRYETHRLAQGQRNTIILIDADLLGSG